MTKPPMGIEYRLTFAASDRATVADVLRRLPNAHEVAASGRFDFLDAGRTSPQATVEVEPDGAYFCDHCAGDERATLGAVVAALVSAFGPLVVSEL